MSTDPPSPATRDFLSAETDARIASSSEAESAPEGRDSAAGRGLFSRLFEAFTSDPTEDLPDAPDASEPTMPGAPGLMKLRTLRVDDVTLPKSEIVAAPVTISLMDLVALFRDNGVSRIPIYRDTLDAPLGMIHIKDLALKYGFVQPVPDFTLRPMLRPLLFVPPSMSAATLLQMMQQKRTHMALVIDEYGGVDGLVTIEDLIEQIIGEIEDEHDELDPGHWMVERPGQWLIEARTELDEVEEATGLDLTSHGEDDEVDTLAGLMVLLAGRVPDVGEVITHPGGARFEVVEGDARRVRRLRLFFPSTRTLDGESEAAG